MDDDFPTIRTGNGFQNDLIATTNDRIRMQVLATRDLNQAIAALESSIKTFNDDSTTQTKELIALTKSIKKLNTEASQQTTKLISLTKWIVALTIILVIGLTVQIIAIFK